MSFYSIFVHWGVYSVSVDMDRLAGADDNIRAASGPSIRTFGSSMYGYSMQISIMLIVLSYSNTQVCRIDGIIAHASHVY